ncbi:MAG: hypothetical protein L0H96_19470, partial [Humibacillus sp.]|nr:hypothetical protein [Humibacillus sp.]MDN5779077.1 hypothetical protein [Humibacillus sp.]
MVSSTSVLGASLNDLIGKLNDWEREYGELLQELGTAHRDGDVDRAARVEAAMRHVSFLFDATRARIDVLTSMHMATWPPLLAERAEAQGRQLSRATWVLAVATIVACQRDGTTSLPRAWDHV